MKRCCIRSDTEIMTEKEYKNVSPHLTITVSKLIRKFKQNAYFKPT